jgi:hypothetical protein
MAQAIGRLRYGPQGATVPRKGRWIILECDRDWFAMFAPQVHRKIPGRWANVVDEDRHHMDGVHRHIDPRLALVKPGFQEPAWHPHISITRNERLASHKDVWDLGVAFGDVQQEMVSMVESGKHHEAKVLDLVEELRRMGPGTKPKYRIPVEEALERSRHLTRHRTRRLARLERDESRLLEEWDRMQADQDLPDFLNPGGNIQFGVNMDLKLARTHWYLDAKCRTLGRIRHFFGLDPRPRVPFHLTVGVTSGV